MTIENKTDDEITLQALREDLEFLVKDMSESSSSGEMWASEEIQTILDKHFQKSIDGERK